MISCFQFPTGRGRTGRRLGTDVVGPPAVFVRVCRSRQRRRRRRSIPLVPTWVRCSVVVTCTLPSRTEPSRAVPSQVEPSCAGAVLPVTGENLARATSRARGNLGRPVSEPITGVSLRLIGEPTGCVHCADYRYWERARNMRRNDQPNQPRLCLQTTSKNPHYFSVFPGVCRRSIVRPPIAPSRFSA